MHHPSQTRASSQHASSLPRPALIPRSRCGIFNLSQALHRHGILSRTLLFQRTWLAGRPQETRRRLYHCGGRRRALALQLDQLSVPSGFVPRSRAINARGTRPSAMGKGQHAVVVASANQSAPTSSRKGLAAPAGGGPKRPGPTAYSRTKGTRMSSVRASAARRYSIRRSTKMPGNICQSGSDSSSRRTRASPVPHPTCHR